MIIITQKGTALINSAYLVNLYLGGDGRSIKANMTVDGTECGKYRDSQQAMGVLDMFAAAWRDGEDLFQFPKEESLSSMPRQHTSSVTNRKVGHGGS